MKKLKKPKATRLSKDEQITRLCRQRNALYEMIRDFDTASGGDNFDPNGDDMNLLGRIEEFVEVDVTGGVVSTRFDAAKFVRGEAKRSAKLFKDADKIVGPAYADEGFNFIDNDLDDETDPEATRPYVQAVRGGERQ